MMGNMLDSLLEQPDNMRVVFGIIQRGAVTAEFHQPQVFQQPQLMRGGRLAQAQAFGNIAYGMFAAAQ